MKRKLDMAGMVHEFQCPGCCNGDSPDTCEKFKLASDSSIPWVSWCENHRASTFILGIGRFALGLPKGFNRYGCGTEIDDPKQKMLIRLSTDRTYAWDKFNVPVWKMVRDGFLFVRTYSPRNNRCSVDIVQGGSLEAPGLEHAIDAGEFFDEMD